MKYDFDLICIGLGPAGMAVSAMGAEMGVKAGRSLIIPIIMIGGAKVQI